MSNFSAEAVLPPCSIAIKCADDPRLERCLDSIDEPDVAVNVVMTPSDQTEALLKEREIPYVQTEYGNIAKSAQLSVETAEHDAVIVMDSDAYFLPGAIHKLREALLDNLVAKPQLVFASDGSRVSKIISQGRHDFNARPDFATNPGLAVRRAEVEELCGPLFNPLVRWTEDADLNFRMNQAGVGLLYVPDAQIAHDPVTFRHEMRCAFLYGVGKRLSVEHTPGREPEEEFGMIFRHFRENFSFEGARQDWQETGLDTKAISALWRTLYYAGYHAQKQLGRWSVEA